MKMRWLWVVALASVALQAFAQDYPTKTVRLINAFTPGGGSDMTARIFAERLQELWKQPVVVENKPGGGGSIAADYLLKQPADGYTIMVFSNTHVINQVVTPDLQFNILEDFVPVATVANGPMAIVVNPGKITVTNTKDFVAMLKAAPGKYEYTACNVSSAPHFAVEMFKNAMEVNALHVPHKGCGPSVADLVAGHISIGAITMATALPFMKEGKLRAIALLSAERSPAAPDVPTLRESGYPQLKDFSFENYFGFLIAKGTPPAIAQKLEADVLKVAAMPETRAKIEGIGIDMYVHDSKATRAMFRRDYENLSKVAKAMNIKSE